MNRKYAAFLRSTFYGGLSSMHTDDVFYDGKTQPGPAEFSASRLVDTVEPFKDAGQVLTVDPTSLILDVDSDPAIFAHGGDVDIGPFGTVFHGVVQEILDSGLKQVGIPADV